MEPQTATTSDLEIFRTTVAHQRPQRVLYHMSFTEDLHRRVREHIGQEEIDAYFGLYTPRILSLRKPDNLPPLDFSPYWENQKLPEGTTINQFGVAVVPAGFYHFFGYVSPLRDAASIRELEQFPMEDVSDWDFSHLTSELEQIHRAGEVAMMPVGHMYETVWQIRGYEQFLMDTIERPDWAECLLERRFQRNLKVAVEGARAGADVIRCGDDVANQKTLMFSYDTWKSLLHSRWEKLWRSVKQINPDTKIWYHSDGNIASIMDDLVDAGVDIINPLQPECLDVDAIYRRYGGRLTFDGCIGTQTTMPFGTPQDVRRRVKNVIDAYGQNGGLIISPTHVLEPEVPIANIEAMVQACREYQF